MSTKRFASKRLNAYFGPTNRKLNVYFFTENVKRPSSTRNKCACTIESLKNSAEYGRDLGSQEKQKGELTGASERTETDKKRARREKKKRQRAKQKQKEKKQQLVEKMNPGLGNKYSKEKAMRDLEAQSKLGKSAVTVIKVSFCASWYTSARSVIMWLVVPPAKRAATGFLGRASKPPNGVICMSLLWMKHPPPPCQDSKLLKPRNLWCDILKSKLKWHPLPPARGLYTDEANLFESLFLTHVVWHWNHSSLPDAK